MSDHGAKVDFLRRLGVTNLPAGAADAPGGGPDDPPVQRPADPNANAGWQGSVQQGAAVTAHTNLRTGQAQPTDATMQVQAGATYQAHPDGQRGVELGLTAQYGQTSDTTGQQSESAGVAAQVAYVAPVGPVVTQGQRVTLGVSAGVGLGASDYKGDLEWQWCAQCDARRTKAQAGACISRFCQLRGAA